MTHSRKPIALSLLTGLILSGCVVGPDYKRPQVTVPDSVRGQVTPADAASLADQPWWSVFGDPRLQDLIREATANNYDLQIAAARIERARALVDAATAQGLPQIDYELNAGGERTVVQGLRSADGVNTAFASGTLRAAWELDMWGRIKRSTEGARAALMTQEDIRHGVMLSLVSDVATGYFRLVELDRELQIAQESAATFGKSFDFYTLRFENGRDSRLPVDRAKADVDASNAQVADIKRAIAIQENALSILLGAYPHEIVRGQPLTAQTVPPTTPVGASTALLQRRPDIQAAEHTMMRANAEIGVAVANYFPRIGLGALLGVVGLTIDGDWQGFGLWNLGLSAAGPIYQGGRLKAAYNERRAFWDETVAEYRKTVIGAFQETADALAAQQHLVARRTALEAQVESLRRASSTARDRYDFGLASYYEVLEADQQLFPAEVELARTQRDQLLAVVDLYRALGGGWQVPATTTAPQPAAGG